MEHHPPYTILVNSSDAFQDCWDPFFTLYTCYWNPAGVPVLLNTEWKDDYRFPGVDIRCSRAEAHAGQPGRRLTWSECLIQALEQVETDYLVYLQEDYFLEAPVQDDLIRELISYLQGQPEVGYIGLTHFGNLPPFKPWPEDDRLAEIGRTPYRISTQAGIWKKSVLQRYLRPEENGWMFEIYGTRRAWRSKDVFLTLNRERYHAGNPALLYTHTGIIKGQWHPAIPDLFARHDIPMDFGKRGFYSEKTWLLRKWETGRKLLSHPRLFMRGMRGI